VLINTGYPLPPEKNAVIMIENVLLSDDGSRGVIRAPVYPWQHVRKVGEDIVATELLFPTGHQIRPADAAALLTGGCATIEVRRRPTVVIIPTGSELVNLDEHPDGPPPGKTVESNSVVLAGLAEQAGAEAVITPIVSDEFATIRAQVLAMVEGAADLVIVNAGSSAGSADYTVRIIEELGEVLVHGVTIMPGKPTILCAVKGKPVIGLPGYPVSAIIAMEQFVVPLLAHMQGLALPVRPEVEAVLARDLPSSSGVEEFRRMIVGRIGARCVAVPLKKGAGAITTLTRANGMLRIAAGSEGEKAGRPVTIELLVPREQVERTILCTGSHDLCLDLLNDLLRKQDPAYPLASTHVGSLGGIMALKEGMCHSRKLAGTASCPGRKRPLAASARSGYWSTSTRGTAAAASRRNAVRSVKACACSRASSGGRPGAASVFRPSQPRAVSCCGRYRWNSSCSARTGVTVGWVDGSSGSKVGTSVASWLEITSTTTSLEKNPNSRA
jgi:putative molybdopterin biosynthesis protein